MTCDFFVSWIYSSQYIKQMGAYDALAGSQRPPSARQLKAGVKATTESHVLLEVLGRLLACGVNSVRNLASSFTCERS